MARKPKMSAVEKSIAGKIMDVNLVQRMGKMSAKEIEQEFLEILSSEDLSAAQTTVNKWKMQTAKNRNSKNQLMFMISNLVLAGDNLSVS